MAWPSRPRMVLQSCSIQIRPSKLCSNVITSGSAYSFLYYSTYLLVCIIISYFCVCFINSWKQGSSNSLKAGVRFCLYLDLQGQWLTITWKIIKRIHQFETLLRVQWGTVNNYIEATGVKRIYLGNIGCIVTLPITPRLSMCLVSPTFQFYLYPIFPVPHPIWMLHTGLVKLP